MCLSWFCVVSFTRCSTDDGYRLTYLGYDFLAIKAMAMRDTLVGVGGKCGVGKASALRLTFDGPRGSRGRVFANPLHYRSQTFTMAPTLRTQLSF